MPAATPKQQKGYLPTRIVIADNQTLFRKGLQLLLNHHPHLQVVATAANGKELLEQVEAHLPDVVITDIFMPGINGLQATGMLTERFPHIPAIALTMTDQETMICAMIQAGAKGYLLKDATEPEILHAIEKVKKKEAYYCAQTTSRLLSRIIHHSHDSKALQKEQFNQKEISIMNLLCHELSSKEIATHLHLNTRAVETARAKLQEKTGARNMVGIALFAIKNGFFNFHNQN